MDGHVFPSKHEANRYSELKLLERAGYIRDLLLQVPLVIEVNHALICKYIADFKYWSVVDQKTVWEDAKGFRTPEYRLKKKLVKAVWDIDIQEV